MGNGLLDRYNGGTSKVEDDNNREIHLQVLNLCDLSLDLSLVFPG